MTEVAETPTPAPRSPPPGAPKPTTLLAALIIAGVLVYNLQLDASSDTYDGSKLTYALAIGMLLVLGVDLGRFWRDR